MQLLSNWICILDFINPLFSHSNSIHLVTPLSSSDSECSFTAKLVTAGCLPSTAEEKSHEDEETYTKTLAY